MFDAPQYRVTGIALLLGCMLFPATARSQSEEEQPGERAAAEVMFEAGRTAMADGNYDEACEKFEASMKLDPAPGTLLNLGNCEEKRGRIASAWERYVAAQRELPSNDRRREFAAKKAKELEGAVPRLTISLAADAPENTQIHRGEVDLTGSVGVALPLDPGSYSILVAAEGYEERAFDVELAVGEARSLEVWPGEKLPEPPPQKTPASTPTEEPVQWGPLTKRQWGYVAGGVGIAGIATALTTGALAIGEMQTMDDHCDVDTGRCDPTGIEADANGETYVTIANVAGAIGVAALGTGVYLVLTSGSGSTSVSSSSAASSAGPSAKKSRTGKELPRVEFGSFRGYHGLRVTGQF